MTKTNETKYKYELTNAKIKDGNIWLQDAFCTICKMHEDKTYVCEFVNMDEDDNGDSKFYIYERNYIITLASLFSEYKAEGKNKKLPGLINGEVAKKLKLQKFGDKGYLQKYIEIKQKYEPSYKKREQVHVFPDFLVHESNSFDSSNMSRKTQHLVMEAKTTEIKTEKFFWFDFLKLNFYLEELQFDNAVYFILGTPLSSINSYIQSYMDKIGLTCGDDINRLFFIVQETIEREPELYVIKKADN